MPVVKSLMKSLRSRYGPQAGEDIYYKMEAEASGPFSPGNKHHADHRRWAKKNGVKPITTKRRKKKAPSR